MKNKIRSLRNSEATVLAYIVEHGPVHGYLIQKLSNLSGKTTYVALKDLVENGLLVKVAAEKRNRPGQQIQRYRLTLRGLCVGLEFSDILWKKIDTIVEKWKNLLPLIFERWERFNAAGLAEEVKKALESSLEVCAMDWKFGHKWDDESGRGFAEDRFLNNVVNEAQPPAVRMKWNRVVGSDKELRQRQQRYQDLQFEIYQALTDHQRKKQEITKMLQKTNPDWKEIEKLEAEAERPKIVMKSMNETPE